MKDAITLIAILAVFPLWGAFLWFAYKPWMDDMDRRWAALHKRREERLRREAEGK